MYLITIRYVRSEEHGTHTHPQNEGWMSMVCGAGQVEFSHDLGADFLFQGFVKYDLNFSDFLTILQIYDI